MTLEELVDLIIPQIKINLVCEEIDETTITRGQARRDALAKRATPKWLDQNERNQIEDFYYECPIGCEVDHIVPLQGTSVCGLHTINNLQYLPSLENRSKSNRAVARGSLPTIDTK